MAAEQDVFIREVDEAVRADQLDSAAKRYGIPAAIILVLGLAGFGGYLFWKENREGTLETQSEELIGALDAMGRGDNAGAEKQLATLASDADNGVRIAAKMTQAGLAAGAGRSDDAVKIYDAIKADDSAPQAYRDLATIRAIAINFDSMEPKAVIDQLRPLAVADNAWFGSAGELVGAAYLKMGDRKQAGKMFGDIAKDENVPQTLRSRARQMAGLLGVDAVEDVDKAMERLRSEGRVAEAPNMAAEADAPPAAGAEGQ
ncbi:tetratricopeptide repeat protein [Altererythrobacter xixiisoli]|uniref:Tetratricopeptide repeat protein n=1 Tax=Croceibacterium xixiisoli TaxID=1476466 RepID=A0A6I4TUE8_9SPHN|nr:tetratricopeptide repeat protein [Croceibacterium xixiisoli]